MNRVIRTKSGHRPDVHWSRAAGRGRIMWIVECGSSRSAMGHGLRPASWRQACRQRVKERGHRRNRPLLSIRVMMMMI